jgi:hypothetical protein
VAGQRVGDRQQLTAGLAAQAASSTETPKKLQIATWSIGVTNVRTVAIAMTTGIASQSKATAAETAHRAVPVARLPDCEAMSISHETSICEYWPVTMTVVIPAHQEAEIIGACLSSLLRQDYEHAADVVVVANGCTTRRRTLCAGTCPRWLCATLFCKSMRLQRHLSRRP